MTVSPQSLHRLGVDRLQARPIFTVYF